MIEEAVDLLSENAHGKGLELVCRIDPAIPATLIGDPLRLRQIVLNLVGNAIKFTEAGEVEIRVSSERTEADGTWLNLDVRDTGIGIPPAIQQKIFDSSSSKRSAAVWIPPSTALKRSKRPRKPSTT